jgi:SAM-dependent methyltransferase
MNNKIFSLIQENLRQAFKLKKYKHVVFNETTYIESLPWTPVQYRKFKDAIESELELSINLAGTILDIVNQLDLRYSNRFFGEIWKPHTDNYSYTGWALVNEVNSHNFKSILDVGCGYNHLKERIPNLIGIDPYNDCADFMVDILDYVNPYQRHDCIIALGSINFNDRLDIEQRFATCVNLLTDDGYMYFRANPGIPHKNGPYVDIFPWSFSVVRELAQKYKLNLLTYKEDHDRLYFVYTKQ